MIFNKIGGYREIHEGRYIGGGRDKSAPTIVPIHVFIIIIAIPQIAMIGPKLGSSAQAV